jgi:hypothetical protein
VLKSNTKILSLAAIITCALEELQKTQAQASYHHPWCGGEVNALGWGVLTPNAIVVPKNAHHHG